MRRVGMTGGFAAGFGSGGRAAARRPLGVVRILSLTVAAATLLIGCQVPAGGGGGAAPTPSPATTSGGPTVPGASGSPSPTSAPAPSQSPSGTPGPVATTPGPVPTTAGGVQPTMTAAPTDPPAGVTAKKGASAWYFDKIAPSMSDAGISWFYNWAAGPDRIAAPKGVEFVPMIWGSGSVTPGTIATAKASGKTLLGFNEPDLAGQADMPVETALDLWPQLQATGMRLGSPAPASGGADDKSWFGRFMAGAAERGYKVDFIALHWYGSDFDPTRATAQLRSYIQAVYDKYHLPIWLTEYSLMDFSTSPATVPSPQGQAAFVTASTDMLESLPFVERYAWFAFPFNSDSRTGLYDQSGQPTPAGVAYRVAGNN